MPLLTLPAATNAQGKFPTAWRGDTRFSIEFSPGTGPNGIPLWVDITSRVQSATINRGRQRILDRFEAGTASVVLRNDDRLFDPSNSAGTYAGKLVPMVPFRIRAQNSAGTYSRFTGFADSWVQRYDRGNHAATCTVALTDAFKVLSLTRPPSPWALRIQSFGSNVDAWYRLSETESSTGLKDSSPYGRDGVYSGSPTMAQTGLITNDVNGSVTFTGSSYAYSDAVPPVDLVIYLEAWFKTSTVAAQTIVAYGNPASGQLHCSIEMSASGQLIYRYADNGYDVVYSDTTTATYADGNVHHVALYMAETVLSTSAGDFSILEPVSSGKGRRNTLITAIREVDGSTTGAVTRSSAALANYPAISGRLTIGSSWGANSFTGTIDEVVVYVDPSTVLYLDGNYEAGYAPYSGNDTGLRVTKILDLIDWPSTERTIGTGNSTLQAAEFDGSILDHLQAVSLTEQGRLFVGQDGKIVFQSRRSTSGTASLYTFKDSAAGVRFSDVSFSYDDGEIRNSVVAARANGGQVTVQDATSVASYYERTYSQSGLLYSTDAQTRDFAQWILNRFKDPSLRVDSMRVSPLADPANLFPTVFSLELGSVVTVERTPQGVGSAISTVVFIEGIAETITPDNYTVDYRLASADTSYYWILGDATYGRLGSTTRLAF